MGDAWLSAEVSAMLARASYLADYGPLTDYLENLTADAEWSVPSPGGERRVQDRATIEVGITDRRAASRQGPGSSARHVLNTVEVVDNGDGTVSAISYYTMWRGIDAQPEIASMGRYYDDLRREDGRWRIARRRVESG